MKTIMNICLTGPYSDGFTYQDNLLPKYQRRLGYRVVVIAPTWRWSKKSSLEHVAPSRYIDKDGVEIVRIENDQGKSVACRFKTYRELKDLLLEYKPDIIFLHGLQMRNSATVARYVKMCPGVRLFVDNHADDSNSATNWLSRNVLHRIVWRRYAKLLEPLTEKFWGVLPARVDFLVENYGLPREKCGLLVMGADDDEVMRASGPSVREATRNRFGFSEDDFVVVTGGKIDPAKTQTFLLMDAVRSMGGRTKLLVFGPVDPTLLREFESRMEEKRIIYVPWADSSESYDYFSAADVLCFPGRHSVYWEQAAAMGKPLIVKRWPGTQHVDARGNAIFLDEDSVDEIRNAITKVLMEKGVAGGIYDRACDATELFLYSGIARRSIGLTE